MCFFICCLIPFSTVTVEGDLIVTAPIVREGGPSLRIISRR
jgi:hypothetical protein